MAKTTSMRIDSLTPEQTARFGEWSKKWIGIGLSTEPANFEAATEAALKAYQLCNLQKPMVVLRMGSPYAATVGGALAWQMLKSMGSADSQVGAQVGAQVRDQVGAQVGDQVRDQVRAQVRAQVGAESFQAAKDGLYNEGASNIGWAGFAAWVSYFRDVCGWKNESLKKFEITETLVKSCGWTWWHQNVLSISDRPQSIKRDDEGRLHCENGPSIAYRDGWALYHWHGVSIPGGWVTGKPPTAKEALTWPNVEQRRAACEIIGWANVLDAASLNPKIIDQDQPHIGTLIEVDLPDAPGERFIKYQCGTGRWFAESVNDKSFDTALKANAGGNGWRGVGDPESFIPFIRT